MLFELRPDLFPAGYLTATEIELWGIYYEEKKERHGRSAKNR
jgi:hypothetical protein